MPFPAHRPLALGAIALAAALAWLGATDARAGRYATSNSPYWLVGSLDTRLSALCRKGEFNQRRDEIGYIGYIGGQGRATTGFAKKGFNLKDRRGVAEPGVTYHFFNDGHSNCKVYVAGSARRR